MKSRCSKDDPEGKDVPSLGMMYFLMDNASLMTARLLFLYAWMLPFHTPAFLALFAPVATRWGAATGYIAV